ncbi:uncharacterized protein LOC117504639 [Thalassophryne amazonica]|uniref:uncharacterized protein LOC117504639 n=1 Tax=Thalassophryne amazonica TaxID=390379 RepID=UPI00147104C8|nr:uncharacterized protein LOC117504639 [Thalassophryne amazonica]
MFRLLKSLTALILLGTGTCQVITKSGLMDISSCPITFYGQRYERLLVNTTHDAFTVCFTGHVKPGTTGDCIVVPRVTGDSFQSDIRTDFFRLGSPLHQQVPTVKTEGTCFIDVAMGSTSETEIFLTLFNFGTQAVMWLMKTIDHPNGVLLVDLLVNGETIQQLNISNNHTKSGSFYDISGCRYSGGVLRPNTLLSLERCSRVNCDETAVLRRIRLCDPTGHCHGNGQQETLEGFCITNNFKQMPAGDDVHCDWTHSYRYSGTSDLCPGLLRV